MKNLKSMKYQRLLAYLMTPIVFTFVAYLLIFCILSATVGNVGSYWRLVMLNDSPDFESSNIDLHFEPASDDGAEMISLSDVQFPRPGAAYGQIEIPACDISCKLLYGDTDAILDKGAGQYMGSCLPGYGKTTLIAGHNTSYFETLKEIEIGDEITITTTYGVYRYVVEQTKIKDKNDTSAFTLPGDHEQLVLYTCYRRYTSIGKVVDRLYVYGKLLSGPTIVK